MSLEKRLWISMGLTITVSLASGFCCMQFYQAMLDRQFVYEHQAILLPVFMLSFVWPLVPCWFVVERLFETKPEFCRRVTKKASPSGMWGRSR